MGRGGPLHGQRITISSCIWTIRQLFPFPFALSHIRVYKLCWSFPFEFAHSIQLLLANLNHILSHQPPSTTVEMASEMYGQRWTIKHPNLVSCSVHSSDAPQLPGSSSTAPASDQLSASSTHLISGL